MREMTQMKDMDIRVLLKASTNMSVGHRLKAQDWWMEGHLNKVQDLRLGL